MGQKRISVVDPSQEEEQQKVSQKKVVRSVGKTTKAIKGGKGIGRLVDKGEPIEAIKLEEETKGIKAKEAPKKEALKKPPRERSRRYKLARSRIDRTITYPLDKAIDLVKKTSIARFNATVSAHLNLTQNSLIADVAFPHPTGKKTRVAVATNATLKKIKDKKIDFDVLLASPEQMADIKKLAKILGPAGLMPNPKNGTITDNPKQRKKELETGTTQVKTESKAPLMHVVIGKTSNKNTQLTENLKFLVNAVGINKIKKLTLASSMSPGVKVELSDFQKA